MKKTTEMPFGKATCTGTVAISVAFFAIELPPLTLCSLVLDSKLLMNQDQKTALKLANPGSRKTIAIKSSRILIGIGSLCGIKCEENESLLGHSCACEPAAEAIFRFGIAAEAQFPDESGSFIFRRQQRNSLCPRGVQMGDRSDGGDSESRQRDEEYQHSSGAISLPERAAITSKLTPSRS